MSNRPQGDDPFQGLPDWLVLLMITLFLLGAGAILFFDIDIVSLILV